nr:hypothetical protein [Rickettsia endosymbiont of Ceutorhynchus assimilis]
MKYSKTIKNFIPQKYKAVIYEEFGNPSSVLKVVEVNRLELRAGEILVQMKLCSINYSDLLTIQGVYKSRVSLSGNLVLVMLNLFQHLFLVDPEINSG